MDIIHRLNALASNEHDDLTIGFEAAATIIDLRLETKEQAREIERLRTRVEETERRLLHHYDALSDWPLPEDHARDMCKRIEELFPQLVATATVRSE